MTNRQTLCLSIIMAPGCKGEKAVEGGGHSPASISVARLPDIGEKQTLPRVGWPFLFHANLLFYKYALVLKLGYIWGLERWMVQQVRELVVLVGDSGLFLSIRMALTADCNSNSTRFHTYSDLHRYCGTCTTACVYI